MKKFIDIIIYLAFFGSLIGLASSIEGGKWGFVIISMIIFGASCYLSKFVTLEDID